MVCNPHHELQDLKQQMPQELTSRKERRHAEQREAPRLKRQTDVHSDRRINNGNDRNQCGIKSQVAKRQRPPRLEAGDSIRRTPNMDPSSVFFAGRLIH